MAARPLTDLVGPGWADALAPVADDITRMGAMLRAEIEAGRSFLPEPDLVLAAFATPLEDVRVLVIGQDPYPTPGHAMGLAFSVQPDVRPVPRSLDNIFREYTDDLGHPRPADGDLTPWAAQGVMLLNRCLTVRPGEPASHRGMGWEAVTEQAVRALVARGLPLVAVLWGADARGTKAWLGDTPVVESVHPSPLSASRGFFGSRPFSAVDEHLRRLGAPPIDWRLPAAPAAS